MAEASVSALSGSDSVEERPEQTFSRQDKSAGAVGRVLRLLRNTSGIWAITDQAIVSAGNAISNIYIGRTLDPSHHGLFGLVLSTMLYLNSLQAALVIYPLSVKGAVVDTARLRAFTGVCLMLTLLCGVPLALATGLIGGIFGESATLAIWTALALLLWQLQETLRRILSARLRFKESVWGDGVRYLGQAAIIFFLAMSGMLTLTTAFATIAGTSVIAGLFQAWQVGIERPRWQDVKDFAYEFWCLGRWMLAGNVTLLVSTLGLEYALSLSWGLATMGQFQAMSTIVKLSHPLLFGIGAIITPVAARAFSDGGTKLARSLSAKYALQGLLLLLPFYGILLIIPTVALRLFYPNVEAYAGLGNELRIYVLWYMVLYAASVLGAYLSGLERARHHFHAQIIHAFGSAVIALPLTYFFGLSGMLIGGVIAKLTLCAAILYYIRYAHRQDDAAASHGPQPPTPHIA